MISRTGWARLFCRELEPAAENQQGDPAEHDAPGCDVHTFEVARAQLETHNQGDEARRGAEHAADRSGQVQFLLQAVHSASPRIVVGQYSREGMRDGPCAMRREQ